MIMSGSGCHGINTGERINQRPEVRDIHAGDLLREHQPGGVALAGFLPVAGGVSVVVGGVLVSQFVGVHQIVDQEAGEPGTGVAVVRDAVAVVEPVVVAADAGGDGAHLRSCLGDRQGEQLLSGVFARLHRDGGHRIPEQPGIVGSDRAHAQLPFSAANAASRAPSARDWATNAAISSGKFLSFSARQAAYCAMRSSTVSAIGSGQMLALARASYRWRASSAAATADR